MLSAELELVLLIVALYGSTCVAFVYADEGVLLRALGGLDLRIADERIRIAGRSLLWLNPLAPMWPAFRGRFGDPAATVGSPLPAPVADALAASRALSPFVIAVALLFVVGIPLALLLGGAARAIPVALAAYLAVVALLLRLWFLRRRFGLDGLKFALVAFESIACPPFAAGIVRRLTLAISLEGDLVAYRGAVASPRRARVVAALANRCAEIASFHADESAERARFEAYAAQLAALADTDAAGEQA